MAFSAWSCIHTFSATRPTVTPDPVTKLKTASTVTVATNWSCLIEGMRGRQKGSPLGEVDQADFVMSWQPCLSGGTPGPFLAADDLVTFSRMIAGAPVADPRTFFVGSIVDDTLRPSNPYMTCELREKK